MFPKAHAIAYVMMALRIAWFKVHYPKLFYSAWLSKRAKGYSVQAFLGGPQAIRAKIEEIKSKGSTTATDDDLITALQIALEMTLRGIRFLPVDINKSSATVFEIEGDNLRIPFVAVDKLGENAALNIVRAREERMLLSVVRSIILLQICLEKTDSLLAYQRMMLKKQKDYLHSCKKRPTISSFWYFVGFCYKAFFVSYFML